MGVFKEMKINSSFIYVRLTRVDLAKVIIFDMISSVQIHGMISI